MARSVTLKARVMDGAMATRPASSGATNRSSCCTAAPPAGLRVLQWNVLADGLAQSGDFSRVDKEYLEWSYRAPRLLNMILKDQPHVMCLQELNHFHDYFLQELKQHGYDGEFWQKPGVVSKKSEFPMDGCAIFYKTSRLQLLECITIQYEDSTGSKLNQGGQICRFNDLDAKEDFVIVNTHLKAKDGDVNENLRFTEIRQLLQRLGIVTKGLSIAIIFCGDLNADPFSKTCNVVRESLVSVYSLICPCEAPHLADELGVIEFCNTVSNGGAQAEPLFTTWKFRSNEAEKRRTIDYIWFNIQGKLVPHKRWTLPSLTNIGANALPSAFFPSDHLSLMCEFRWKVSGSV